MVRFDRLSFNGHALLAQTLPAARRTTLGTQNGPRTVTPAIAQQAADLPRYELAVGFAPFFRADEGAEATQAPSAWITLPVGRLGVQIDYLRNVRSRWLYYLGYSHTDDQGREIRYSVARADFDVEQMVSSAIRWPFPGLGGRSYLLIGGAWQYNRRRPCVAISPGDRPEHGARVDFPPGFECSRSPVVKSRIHAAPLYGVGVDLPLGSRFFGSLQYRARWLPSLGELRVGAGIHF